MRTFLRLEFLFQTGMYHAKGRSVWDSRAAMGCLLDILAIFGEFSSNLVFGY